MKISASVLAADQNEIINNLNKKKDLFDYVHIDIGDNVFCPTYGISKDNVYKSSRPESLKERGCSG